MSRTQRWFELVALFGVLPAAIWLARLQWRGAITPGLIPILLVVFVFVLIALRRDLSFDRRQFGTNGSLRGALPIMLGVLPIPALLLAGGVAFWRPELLLEFPRQRPVLYSAVMVLYPLVSVYPQEVIWRTFFFHRYQPLLDGVSGATGRSDIPYRTVLLSALTFGWMHCIFNNWLAVLLSGLGGFLFAWTYARTRSTAAAWLEHAIWGCFVFTIGLGRYFYGGSSG